MWASRASDKEEALKFLAGNGNQCGGTHGHAMTLPNFRNRYSGMRHVVAGYGGR